MNNCEIKGDRLKYLYNLNVLKIVLGGFYEDLSCGDRILHAMKLLTKSREVRGKIV